MKNRKIEIKKGKILSTNELFKAKERFHKELAKLPFEKKIKILMDMRRIVELKGMA